MPESKPLFRKPAIFQPFPHILAAESTRHGGVSQPPYASLNLGGSTQDDPENVAENRHRFYEGLGISANQVASSHQIHGSETWITSQPGRQHGHDSVITSQPGVVALVTVADCTPILVYDAGKNVVAAIHAGWRGTVSEIVRQTLERMQDTFGTRPKDCYAYVGTCIDECSFEVGDEVAEQFDTSFKRFSEEKAKYCVDLKQANATQLRTFGIPENQIEISKYSTVLNNEDYFSYRLEKGQTGRMVAVIGIKG
ncbi:MAG: peptidoglycan editing factor PgeF [Siphonobacter sp.]